MKLLEARLALFPGAAVLVLLVAGLAAACSDRGDDSDTHDHDDHSAYLKDAKPDRTIEFVMTDFAFKPAVINVKADDVIELRVENAVKNVHDFTIDKIDADLYVARVAGDREHLHSEDLPDADVHFAMTEAGHGLVYLKVHEPGTYTIYCTVPLHRDAGMEAKLIVQ